MGKDDDGISKEKPLAVASALQEDENGQRPESEDEHGDPDTAYLSEEDMQGLEDHLQEYIGEVTWVMHEIVSDRLHIDILVVEPTEERDYYTLVTMGMSALPMHLPEELDIAPYAELMICLPSDWVIRPPDNADDATELPPELDPADETNYWPVRWLKILARLPEDYTTWLGYGHSIPAGEALAENTRLNGFILSPPLEHDSFFTLTQADGKEVLFWNLVPVYEEEMQFKLEHSADDLFELFDRYQVSPIVDPARPNLITEAGGPEYAPEYMDDEFDNSPDDQPEDQFDDEEADERTRPN